MTDVKDLRVTVVGGASGIGEALVAALRRDRAATVVIDRTDESEIRADIARPEECVRAVEEAVRRLGGLDGLAVTAGTTAYADISDTAARRWHEMLGVNLVGPALLTRAALPALTASPAASIVVTASAAGRRGYPSFSAYSASKAGLVHWTRSAARELGPVGIRVNCVSPGPIDTPMLRGSQPEGEDAGEWATVLASRTALGRVGRADEVAEAILFLLGRASSYVTGATLDVDGGETA